MSITVNTNMQALRIQGNLSKSTEKMNTAMERMSSGYKINSAKDDAAGMAVSTKLETTISSSKVASDNVQIGSNLLDSSEGTLDTILTNLQRVRDLTEQASTGTYSENDKKAMFEEINQRMAQIDSLSSGTKFNEINLFGDDKFSTEGLDLQVGTDSTSASSLNIDASVFKSAMVSQLGLFNVVAGGDISIANADGTAKTDSVVYIADDAGALTKAANVDEALDAIITGKAYIGATSGVTDTDDATAYTASSFLDQMDNAIANVSDRITKIGAYQNRLESISDSLETQQTNLTAANSTIKDADVAEESASYVSSQILQSASSTLLVQANSAPQIALTLIKGQ